MAGKKKDMVVVFLSEGGYMLSSYYGKILSSKKYATLKSAMAAAQEIGTVHVA